jgi:hypothetical protein
MPMQLFHKKSAAPQTETPAPAPVPVDPLQSAIAEEIRAADAVRQASEACKLLDDDQRSWSARRNAAQENFHKKIELHLRAKDLVSRLSAPKADVVASGTVLPQTVGAVIGET